MKEIEQVEKILKEYKVCAKVVFEFGEVVVELGNNIDNDDLVDDLNALSIDFIDGKMIRKEIEICPCRKVYR